MQIFTFGDGQADGSARLAHLLGLKGASLAEMTRLGVPVPPGFTLTTEVGSVVLKAPRGELPNEVLGLVAEGVSFLEDVTGNRLADEESPLLVSVRSGPAVSMPNVLPSVLNVGLNEKTAEALARKTGDRRFAMDTWAHFIESFGRIVLGVDPYYFSEAEQEVFEQQRVYSRDDLGASELLGLAHRFRSIANEHGQRPLPERPIDQLRLAVDGVFRTWESTRAKKFRKTHRIDAQAGTGVSVQQMVFGNRGEVSGTGMATTRSRDDGSRGVDGLFVANAQGEAFRDRRRDGIPIDRESQPCVRSLYPDVYQSLTRISTTLEAHYRCCQRFEFTVEGGEVWVLETDPFKSFSTSARIRVAVDMVDEALIDSNEAVGRVSAPELTSMLLPRIGDRGDKLRLARGSGVTPGAASGYIVFTAEEAERYAELNMGVILVRTETTTDDMEAIRLSRGVVTSRGGMTSHAAIVTRQMGIPCIVGVQSFEIDAARKRFTVDGTVYQQGDVLTIDGASGEVFAGSVPIVPSHLPDTYQRLLAWADDARTIAVRSNADNATDARLARNLGAEGIGLVRTEHMFFHRERLNPMRRVILAHSERVRRDALEQLRPFQRQDFAEIFRVMDGLPVTVRLFDPPLHEFLPERDEDLEALGEEMGLSAANVRQITRNIRELNPMLGHRGCRLGISHPEIYDMQVVAVFEAVEEVASEGVDVRPELLIPLVSVPEEFRRIRARIDALHERYLDKPGFPHEIPIGSMIEVARACLLADQIATNADFISFGTNDLTQSVFGISRDDASVFLPRYVNEGIIPANPFVSIDREGVGQMIQLAVDRARQTRPDIRVGLCGEQGGDPASVAWLQQGVVDYISCSPYRVPVARLAAGQAALGHD